MPIRTVPTGLLSSPTRCYAIKVIRQDGTILGVTDTNVPFVFEGVAYEPYNGFSASNIDQQAGTGPGELEIVTIEAAVASQITAADARGGAYRGARIFLYELDYTNPGNGARTISQYVMIRATIHDTSIQIKLADITYLLKMRTGRELQPSCDCESTFNMRCDPTATLLALYTYSRTVVSVVDAYTIDFGTETNAAGWYNFGVLTWTTSAQGNLKNPQAAIKAHLSPGGGVARILLNVPCGYTVQVGDVANLTRGCNRTKANCQAIANSHNPSATNVENFQGWAEIPEPDGLNTVGRQAGM